ncbi:MAG: hypothetical protein ABI663_01635 [Chryseolinea sp.]
MNQQPDKLFREKLEGYQKPAPASAWDKIETNLDNKSPKGLWWKIAASLLLIAVATYTLWPKTETTEGSLAKKVEETKSLPTVKEDEVNKELIPTDQTPTVIPEAVQKNNVAKSNNNVAKSNKEYHQPKEKIQEPTIALEESIVPVDENLNEVNPVTENIIVPEVVVANAETTIEKSDEYITLVVTAEEANKYLTKNTNTEATPDGKKTSTFRKLLKKASDLTNDQRPLADLRQKKDEILALNFDSKKQRGQNK